MVSVSTPLGVPTVSRVIHLSNTQDPAGIDKDFLRSRGFDSCKFIEETDRAVVKKKNIVRYGDVPSLIVAILSSTIYSFNQ